MKNWIKMLLFCTSTILFIGCDRVTKDIAKVHLKNKESISYLHDTFRLEYAENTGAAMSLGDKLPKTTSFWLLSILPLIFLFLASVFTIRNAAKISNVKLFLYSLILAGGLSNIIDRIIFDRHVTDFMNLGMQNLRTGIFNFADLYVTIGLFGLLLINIIKQGKSQGRVEITTLRRK